MYLFKKQTKNLKKEKRTHGYGQQCGDGEHKELNSNGKKYNKTLDH